MLRPFIGAALLFVPFGLFALIIRIWPAGSAEPKSPSNPWTGVWTCELCDSLHFEAKLILIVLLAGALGSIVHVATSFASYVGSRKFVDSWGWWYFLRLPVGMGLALILYFALRGGFISSLSNDGVSAEEVVNPFGFAAIAALAGMFSKQATDKLKELFDSLFSTRADQHRTDKLTEGTPKVLKIEPSSVVVGKDAQKVTVFGKNITDETVLKINGEKRDITLDDPDEVQVTLTSADVEKIGSLEIQLVNPDAQGGASEVFTLEVRAADGNG